MAAFSYLAALTSIVLAPGLARLLTGFGRILQARGKGQFYWVQLVWALNLFLYILLIWWILFRWHEWTDWNYFLFLFLFASPIVTFLQAVLLFPETLDERFHKIYALFLLAYLMIFITINLRVLT